MSLTFILSILFTGVIIFGLGYIAFTFYKKNYSLNKLVNKRISALEIEVNRTTIKINNLTFYSSNPYLNEWLLKFEFAQYIQDGLVRLNWNVLVDRILMINIFIALVGSLVVALLGGSILVIFFSALFIAVAPIYIIQIKISRRQAILEKQLPEMLDFISRSMHMGHTFISSLQLAADNAKEPIASEFKQAFQEINFGKSVQNAMSDLSKRINCLEMRYFAVAVFINHEIGGNLASLISGVSLLIRDRIKTKMVLRAMTSEARASAMILSLLPFLVGLLMLVVRPDYVAYLWSEPMGRSMAGYTLVLMFLGIFWMQRMTVIRA